MKMLKVGIVGGAGQVGSALLRSLNTEREIQAFGICRNRVSAARVASLGMPVRIVQTDDPVQLAQETRDLDVIVNCALPQYQPSMTSVANHRLALSLTSACAGKRLVHLSSVAVYGDFLSSRKDFFDHPKPDITYGRQKLQMEQLLRKLAKKHSAKCTILRLGHVYGPQLRWSEGFFDLIKTDGFRLPFDGELASNAIWIDNLIAGIKQVIIAPPAQDTVNLVDSPQTTWREIFDLHSKACGRPAVEPLDQFESNRRFLIAKTKGQTGLAKRLFLESAAWLIHLPSSYVASAPAFKTLSQRIVAGIGSKGLDSRLWALYCRHFSARADGAPGPTTLAVLLSEPVPGHCLTYNGSRPTECLSALEAWHNAISTPHVSHRTIFHSREIAQEIP
jgi:nucleoside-diphosphate-sugar epimerase